MATAQSAQLPLNYSPTIDEMAIAGNSLVLDWDKFSLNFVFSPPVMESNVHFGGGPASIFDSFGQLSCQSQDSGGHIGR